jgi:hypothetical protein
MTTRTWAHLRWVRRCGLLSMAILTPPPHVFPPPVLPLPPCSMSTGDSYAGHLLGRDGTGARNGTRARLGLGSGRDSTSGPCLCSMRRWRSSRAAVALVWPRSQADHRPVRAPAWAVGTCPEATGSGGLMRRCLGWVSALEPVTDTRRGQPRVAWQTPPPCLDSMCL